MVVDACVVFAWVMQSLMFQKWLPRWFRNLFVGCFSALSLRSQNLFPHILFFRMNTTSSIRANRGRRESNKAWLDILLARLLLKARACARWQLSYLPSLALFVPALSLSMIFSFLFTVIFLFTAIVRNHRCSWGEMGYYERYISS